MTRRTTPRSQPAPRLIRPYGLPPEERHPHFRRTGRVRLGIIRGRGSAFRRGLTHLLVSAYLGEDAAGRFLSAYRRFRSGSLDEFNFFEVSAVWRRFLIIVMMLREDHPVGVLDQVIDAIRLLEPAYRRLVESTGTTIAEVESLYPLD